MRRPWIVALALGFGGVGLATVVAQGRPASAAPTAPVTFSKDILPILQKNCQSCHRPGEIAPMSFLTYESTRPWAKAIKSAVLTKKMPPWFADPQHGRFSNDRSLKPEEIDTLSRWADEGAPMGNPADAPPPRQWAEGWQIAPDHVVTAPPYTVPAKGAIEWGYIVVPSGFTTDTWVTSIEIRPGNRDAVHHVVAYIQPSSANVPHNVFIWDQKQRDVNGVATPGQAFLNPTMVTDTGQPVDRSAILDGEIGAVYVPGGQPQDFRARGAAKLIPAGSDLVINVHYQAIGKPVTEITQIGFTLAEGGADAPFPDAGQTAARHFGPENLSDSSRGCQLGESARGDHVQCGRRAGLDDAAHARAREGHDLSLDVSRRTIGNCTEGSALRLQLAARLRCPSSAQARQGHDAPRGRALRQLGCEPREPRSDR